MNQRLAAVRRLAYEADSGLLSPELAAGIRRVRGVKQLGSRFGNWLTLDQARNLLQSADGEGLRCLGDLAMISVLLGCGLRRAELSDLEVDDLHLRQGHCAIVDLVGKCGHVLTVPMPLWVKATVDRWTSAANVRTGRIFRAISRYGTPWGKGLSETSFDTWFGGVPKGWSWIILLPMISAERALSSATRVAGNWSKSNSYSGMSPC